MSNSSLEVQGKPENVENGAAGSEKMKETVGKRASKTPEGENGPDGRPNGLTGVKHGVTGAKEIWTMVCRKTSPAAAPASNWPEKKTSSWKRLVKVGRWAVNRVKGWMMQASSFWARLTVTCAPWQTLTFLFQLMGPALPLLGRKNWAKKIQKT